ncbi:MAG: selenocysteine-specific translation elongation factor [Chloracidobacterium sp.]|nr:selenocysteine-specific translation elongation factor [Chloracidobacterium sp.]
MDVIIGTAGHIDHGKTALVKALTGVDADRLPEEKRRGITVDLGFAEMTFGDVHCGFVDVPGHERFVKNMLAGANGVDLVMLVIAADEGVMPQTREHFDICRLLGINAGVIVLTKTDLVDEQTLELAKLGTAELVSNSFLENAPVVGVSSRTGTGIDQLKTVIRQIATSLPVRKDQLVLRLPIDRSFSMKGFGAVVTGTLASGEISEGTELELLPNAVKVRVRGLQTHGKAVKTAMAGQRIAVNLGGIDHSKITRGMTLVPLDTLRSTQIIDAEIEVLTTAAKSLRSRQRVRVHIGTTEVLARIQVLNNSGEIAPGSKDFAQLRLETQVLTVPSERFIIRSYSPQATIAGGSVIDAFAEKHRHKENEAVRHYLANMLTAFDDINERVRLLVNAAGASGFNFAEVQARTALRKEILEASVDANLASNNLVEANGRNVSSGEFTKLLSSVETTIEEFHVREPLAKGIAREALREKLFAFLPIEIFHSVVDSLQSTKRISLDKETIRIDSYHQKLSPEEAAFSDKILSTYRSADLEVPKLEEALAESLAGTKLQMPQARKLFQMFLDSGEIVKVTDTFYFAKNAIDKLADQLKQFAATTNDRLIDVPKFKELAGISRKYAIPLLEYFDREHITTRAGDKRHIAEPRTG